MKREDFDIKDDELSEESDEYYDWFMFISKT
jgi:hypothetical protein